jgi:hypothetical protein
MLDPQSAASNSCHPSPPITRFPHLKPKIASRLYLKQATSYPYNSFRVCLQSFLASVQIKREIREV